MTSPSSDEAARPISNANAPLGPSNEETLSHVLGTGSGFPLRVTANAGLNNSDLTESAPQTPEDVLPRDIQLKTPTYDYAFEKSMSHTEAKLFYQHHQLATRNVGDSDELSKAAAPTTT
ncbi:hypothetical protein BO99DRAFT_380949, partial [Aspergillus violaceofuscus CBS 115571]